MDDDCEDYSSNLLTPPDYTSVDLSLPDYTAVDLSLPDYTTVDSSLPTYEDAVRGVAGGTTTIIAVPKPDSDDEISTTSTQTDDVSRRNRYASEPVSQSCGQNEVQPLDFITRMCKKIIKLEAKYCATFILLSLLASVIWGVAYGCYLRAISGNNTYAYG